MTTRKFNCSLRHQVSFFIIIIYNVVNSVSHKPAPRQSGKQTNFQRTLTFACTLLQGAFNAVPRATCASLSLAVLISQPHAETSMPVATCTLHFMLFDFDHPFESTFSTANRLLGFKNHRNFILPLLESDHSRECL